jgi:(2S)-methylsuccinyl-CoA dehydrogenase
MSLSDLPALLHDLDNLYQVAKTKVAAKIAQHGFEQEQHAAHGLAWLATYIETLKQTSLYAQRQTQAQNLTQLETLIVTIGFGSYLAQIFGGIAMSQSEYVRLSTLGFSHEESEAFLTPSMKAMIEQGTKAQTRASLMQLILQQTGKPTIGETGLDETLQAIRDEMVKFTKSTVTPFAHHWHLKNDYIPYDTIDQMSELGVFGLTIPEHYSGMGLGKEAMCVVSEELSRGYIGVGSLGTRSEIAAELILGGGTQAQKDQFLPSIASGACLPTAVFTEPNTGSDLASLQTRAVLDGDDYVINGNKTWITHPVRADLMTILVRTNPQESGYKGLSMLLAQKPRGTDQTPFPIQGLKGGEIEVLGYRGMKEYELAFENFRVPKQNLLGGQEGQGFKQLMQTFESARIQTAARAIGVAQNALDLALSYASERVQFGKALHHFPRVADKIVMMVVEIMLARQITYFAARQKDQDKRCDVEAGMAKLLAARVAWSAADNALQIHGGNGFALEYPISRVLCDARIMNIFEGAGEIQAQVIAKRILE